MNNYAKIAQISVNYYLGSRRRVRQHCMQKIDVTECKSYNSRRAGMAESADAADLKFLVELPNNSFEAKRVLFYTVVFWSFETNHKKRDC